MPSDNTLIQIIKFVYCFNILFSYPTTIYPTNLIIDSCLFRRIENLPSKHKIKENISHTLVLLAGILLAVFFYEKLDKLLALSGTILGTMLVLFIPSMCHYKLVAKSKCSKCGDIFIACYAVVVLVICSSNVIKNWNNEWSLYTKTGNYYIYFIYIFIYAYVYK